VDGLLFIVRCREQGIAFGHPALYVVLLPAIERVLVASVLKYQIYNNKKLCRHRIMYASWFVVRKLRVTSILNMIPAFRWLGRYSFSSIGSDQSKQFYTNFNTSVRTRCRTSRFFFASQHMLIDRYVYVEKHQCEFFF
jgi:hypothetical protein